MSTKRLDEILKSYQLPEPLGFGQELAPIMYRADYKDDTWDSGELIPFTSLAINPAATCVQFGQQCFEGMKAYKTREGTIQLFRPEENYARFRRSAERLQMPAPTSEIFANALSSLTQAFSKFVPNGEGQSLYLRPTLLGMDHTFAVKSSETYCFILIASPSDAYYSAPIKVMIERNHARAVEGGTGAVKVGGNYAASMQATSKSINAGYDQPLWLDAKQQKYIEELSGMNFMAIINGELHTPALTGTILPGVTRSSILKIAADQGIKTCERAMAIDELLADIKSGTCTELFACGTAAIISPIELIGDKDGSNYELTDVDVFAKKFRTHLLNIQQGSVIDQNNWMVSTASNVELLDRFESKR
ncbi:branched-chain amino acid aminotransferase [Kordiimonas sp. SCSIO 12610]|uniref:branched-chain amino acid aminotransferase n=1 Tax=Kordiimonas sp. SCSIO 12610 TaxID=2829597 RepID=UPI0021087A31|nr:branched-chain amino acid aminotransferase [Kordiimonas sp. SCSIO 12610]UTW54794.1 branched-chain amino acid aminotransferase [Kordiimonas sp. SCSIO 12610]